jgi:hypothetical protein
VQCGQERQGAIAIHLPDWPAIRAACAVEAWQKAYGLAGPCGGPDDVTWRQVAAYIEARKAEALAALMAAWKEQHP